MPSKTSSRAAAPVQSEVADFIELALTISRGAEAGTPLLLRRWQRQLLADLFATRAGRRKFRRALIGLARKNGKSALGSGIALYGLVMDEPGSEVYSCAGDKDQARIVFAEVKRSIAANETLSGMTKVYRDAIEYPKTGSIYRVLSAEAYTKEGLNPSMVVFDEVHVQQNDDLWNVMNLGSGTRRQPLVIGITTAGVKYAADGTDSLCYRLWQYGNAVNAGEIDDPSFFFRWWCAPDDADYRDPETWKLANPALGDFLYEEDFASTIRTTPEAEFRALDVDTPLLTTGGWKSMGTVAVGDVVYAQDGSQTVVVGVSEVFTGRPCYEVSLSDGRSVIADSDHEWAIEEYTPSTNRRRDTVVKTAELANDPTRVDYIRVAAPIECPTAVLPIDPYVLGAWLGDGCKTHPVISTSIDDRDALRANISAAGYYSTTSTQSGRAARVYVSCCPIRQGGGSRDTLRRRLGDLGIRDDKHVPAQYLTADVPQRLALLRGLMDTDGTVGGGRARFVNTNRNLAESVAFLARSLGWKPTLLVRSNRFGPLYIVAWSCYSDRSPFGLQRKTAKLAPKPDHATRGDRVKVLGVSPVASRPTRCLAVDHPSHVFLVGADLIPTRNTKRLNQWVSASQTWLPQGAWGDCADPTVTIRDGDKVTLGFDGSFNNDSTALVVCSVSPTPHLDVVEAWERPADGRHDWQVPIVDVEEAIRVACRRWSVSEIVCDPFRWARTYQVLEAERLPIVEFPNSPARMVPATQRFYEAVVNRSLTHSGDPRLARHIGNATLKTDARGARLAKESRSSNRKIDLAIAAVMAHERAVGPGAVRTKPRVFSLRDIDAGEPFDIDERLKQLRAKREKEES